jgi:glycosyltransferase involved in cell wall biosynthesis
MKFNSGGHLAQLNFLEVAKSVSNAQPVTYKIREKNTLFLDDILAQDQSKNSIYFIHWGFDIPKLLNRLKGKNVVYIAHSTGYKFTITVHVPIITVSKNSQGYWGRKSPNSLIFYLPNVIADKYNNYQQNRPIDVLIQKRKSSEYLVNQLVPKLKNNCNLELVDYWVDDLATLFNQSKIYLYDSAEYWIQSGFTEGFGLPPLEAIACGCQVFSSINDALSDYLDPSFNCQKLRVYSVEYDVNRILLAVKNWQNTDNSELLKNYRFNYVKDRFKTILTELELFFDHQQSYSPNIPTINNNIFTQANNLFKKIQSKLKK